VEVISSSSSHIYSTTISWRLFAATGQARTLGKTFTPCNIVLLTRVKRGGDFRVLADLTDLDFVEDLLPPVELLAFEEGYGEDGTWHRDRAMVKVLLSNLNKRLIIYYANMHGTQ
jgi:hypothetical protein